jgi:hypothetical protein
MALVELPLPVRRAKGEPYSSIEGKAVQDYLFHNRMLIASAPWILPSTSTPCHAMFHSRTLIVLNFKCALEDAIAVDRSSCCDCWRLKGSSRPSWILDCWRLKPAQHIRVTSYRFLSGVLIVRTVVAMNHVAALKADDHELCHSLMTSHNTMNHLATLKANDHELCRPLMTSHNTINHATTLKALNVQ